MSQAKDYHISVGAARSARENLTGNAFNSGSLFAKYSPKLKTRKDLLADENNLLFFISNLFPLSFNNEKFCKSKRNVSFFFPLFSSLFVRDFNTYKKLRSMGFLILAFFLIILILSMLFFVDLWIISFFIKFFIIVLKIT